MFNIGHKGELISLWCSCSCSKHSPWGQKAAHLCWKGKSAPVTEKTAVRRWAGGLWPLPGLSHWPESPTSRSWKLTWSSHLGAESLKMGGTPLWDCHQEQVSMTIRLWKEKHCLPPWCNSTMRDLASFEALLLLLGQSVILANHSPSHLSTTCL